MLDASAFARGFGGQAILPPSHEAMADKRYFRLRTRLRRTSDAGCIKRGEVTAKWCDLVHRTSPSFMYHTPLYFSTQPSVAGRLVSGQIPLFRIFSAADWIASGVFSRPVSRASLASATARVSMSSNWTALWMKGSYSVRRVLSAASA